MSFKLIIFSSLLLFSFCVKVPNSLKVMTFNIHYGHTIEEEYNIENIALEIKNSKAELICVQEVDVHWASHSLYEDTLKILATITGYHYFYAPIYDRPSQRGDLYPNEQFGVGFLSKYKIVSAKNYKITRWSTQPEDPQPGDDDFPPKKGGFGHIIIDVDGYFVNVFNTHLDYRANPPKGYDVSIRVYQVKEMMEIIENVKKENGYPMILMGDMNSDTTAKDVFDPMLEKFNDSWNVIHNEDGEKGYTYPCKEPSVRIDYILTSKGDIIIKDAITLETYVSDHLPVVVDISFE